MNTETAKGNKKKSKRFKTIDLAYIGIFAALITVCSWISIPLPTVPITLQTMGVCIASGLLGTKRGTLTVIVYILLGLIGVPVFAGFSSGIGVLAGATGGYIIGFIFTALIVGIMLKLLGKKVWVYILSMIIGIAVCYAFGTAWFMIYNNNKGDAVSLVMALGWCVTPFIIPDLVKIAVAAVLCRRLNKYVKN
ncbi:MAG: biotin transporter BioY [Eubacterium sp.]|nr:biotin transporter BioY [Eubacterium sp.]